MIFQLRHQHKDLLVKEKEIADKNKKIEQLSNQINKAKEDSANDNSPILLQRIEALNREKSELKLELKVSSSTQLNNHVQNIKKQ